MSKRARHRPGFYATLLNDVSHRGFNSKYRPKVKPTVIATKRVQGGRVEYFIQWQSYFPSENTWEPAEHLPEELITAFENRSVDPFRADECRERLALLCEKGLKSPLACNETITIRHGCNASALSWFAIRPP